jgi:DNA-directed RNA polymerase specialized sigma24 family protein
VSYKVDEVERMLPYIWGRMYVWGVANPTAPPADMPKAATDKTTSNTSWAVGIDVRDAWDTALIPLDERRATLLHFGAGWTQEDIGIYESVSQGAISKRIKRCLNRLTTKLNGPAYEHEGVQLALEELEDHHL